MKIGFTSTTFRQVKELARVAEIGVNGRADCIEWGGDIHVKNADDAKQAKKICDDAGLPVSSFGSYYRAGKGDSESRAELCSRVSLLGAESIRIWLGDKGSQKTDENEYKALLADTAALCDEAAKYGLTVMPECHPNTFNDNTDAFLRFVKELDRENFSTYFQSLYRDWDYDLDRIKRTYPYVGKVHISYSELVRMQAFRKSDREFIKRILDAFLSLGYDKTVLLEYTYFASEKHFYKDMDRLREDLGIK